jgi:tetratricopeptide (TPR) repeat protein
VEGQAELGEIARLEALVGPDPGAAAFPALAEANRRAGRPEEAERVARDGLRIRPESLAGRVALALSLLDLGRAEEARAELEAVLEAAPDHPLAARELRAAARSAPVLDALDESEIDGAFAEAEAEIEGMVTADSVAAEVLHAVGDDEPESASAPAPGSPFATETVAALLERQGHRAEAAALREEIARRDGARLPEAQRERVIQTLERWLENLRRMRQ